MPYISTEQVKEVRNNLKKEFPEYKFSVRKYHHSQISVAILSGPIELITDVYGIDSSRYQQVNYFWIADHYKNYPEVRDILLKVYNIMNAGNRTVTVDGDYGNIPAFYVSLSIGDYEKPYQIKK